MKKRNLLFNTFIVGLGISLFSCNIGSGGNVTSFPAYPVVACDYSSNLSGVIIGTQWGYSIAPTLDINPGDCMLMSFEINYDNQPAETQYPIVSQINMGDIIDKMYLESVDGPVSIDGYSLSISTTNTDCILSPFYQGKVFFTITCKDKAPRFRLAYNTQEPDSAGIRNLYLLAQPVSDNSSDITHICVFDVYSFIRNYGEETTLTEYGYSSDIKFLSKKVNLKIYDKMSDSDEPIYKSLNDPSKPIPFFIFKENY